MGQGGTAETTKVALGFGGVIRSEDSADLSVSFVWVESIGSAV